jgi:hypothetical protein
MNATECHLLPLVKTFGKLKMASLKLPTDRSPRGLVKGKVFKAKERIKKKKKNMVMPVH